MVNRAVSTMCLGGRLRINQHWGKQMKHLIERSKHILVISASIFVLALVSAFSYPTDVTVGDGCCMDCQGALCVQVEIGFDGCSYSGGGGNPLKCWETGGNCSPWDCPPE